MDEKPYDKITVSDIVEKAGIARQTFYRNYKDKHDVIVEYFSNIFMSELLSIENISDNKKHNNIVLTFNIKYMTKHQANLVKMLTIVGIEKLFADRFNDWLNYLTKQNKVKLTKNERFVYRYKIFYQIIGILMMIMDWFKNGMPIPVSDLVNLLNYFTVDTKQLYENVPNIKIKIIEN
jgi:hypothetical protein